MRRVIAILVLLVATLFTATPANAWWGRGWGWRGHHHFGWRHHGWGGYGWRGYGYGWGRPYVAYRRWGYPYYGGYGGFYGGGYYPYYQTYSPWFGCYNGGSYYDGGYGAGTTVGVGYPTYGLYAANYGASNNRLASSIRPASQIIAAMPARPAAKPSAQAFAPPTALAVQQFLGLKAPQPFSPDIVPSALAANADSPALRALDNILARVSTADSRRKAERIIREGDELFRVQNYHSALQKYKLAASTAPDLPEALWRKGHALVATRNFELATTAFKRAIALTEDLGRDGFRLNDLYAGAGMAKSQHLESLAEWAVSRREAPDPYFLLGLFLNYDGQTARADKFFQKASDLAGISGGHIAVFLDPAEDLPTIPTRPTMRPAVIPVSTGTGTEI